MLLKINATTSILDFIASMKVDLIRISIFCICAGAIAHDPHFEDLDIPLAMNAIIGTAISLLLAFRTGQSYDRWWEARIVWGGIVNDSRSYIRQLQLYLPSENSEDINRFTERQIIWCYALSQSLRKERFTTRLQDYLDREKIHANNIPNALLSKHSMHIKELSQQGLISEFRQVQLDSTLMRFCDSMGRCERIKNTIFPMSYSKLINFLIYLFALMLPFSLDSEYVLIKMIIAVLIPLIFLIIERTAILMQDPFENKPMDIPMTSICQTIEMNLNQMTDQEANTPDPPKNEYYFIL